MTSTGAVTVADESRISVILEFARNIIESTPVGIVSFDGSGQCISANRASARILGTTLEKLLSQNYTKLQTWKASGLLDSANATMMTGQGHQVRIDFRTGIGLPVRLDCFFERFVSGGHRYLLQVVIEPGGIHG